MKFKNRLKLFSQNELLMVIPTIKSSFCDNNFIKKKETYDLLISLHLDAMNI